MLSKAAIADGKGNFKIDSVEVGAPADGEVLVSIKAAGICHTDFASLSWKRPLVMGHEGAGVVVKVGRAVSSLKKGDQVVFNWAIPCGMCFQCKLGNAVLCEISRPAYVMERSAAHAHPKGTLWNGHPIDRSFNIGTLSEFTLVREEALSLLPPGVPMTSAAVVSCGVMTGFGSVRNVARVKKGESVVVVGCGGVGLNIIQGAVLAKAGKIIAIDVHESSLQRAAMFGASHCLKAQKSAAARASLVADVMALTSGRGADHAFEATGIPDLAFLPLQLIRNGGQAFQVSGINAQVNVPMPQFMWNKTYMTPLYGGCVPKRDFPLIFNHYLKRRLLLDELVTRTYRLEEL
ncbi:MAG: S-(hydroxymethyl)mycothiol dehydrogenase, partial [Verrucomicrobiales bacterium]|nr:S-(hydroxymethyl)mycothiol dehydrogenase [Verrucomicrobiales bacterium]